MKKFMFSMIVVFVMAVLFTPAMAFGQFGETNTVSRLFNVETGFLAGYNFEEDETVTGNSVALNLAVMENAEIGFVRTQFDDSAGAVNAVYNLVRFNYFFTEQVAVSLSSGAEGGGDAAGSIGGNFIILRSIPEDGFSSSLKANVQYLFHEDPGVGEGTMGVSLLGTIGL